MGTSYLAGKFATKIGLEDIGKLVGLLHDLGKASEEFLAYISSATGLINPDEDEYVDHISKKGKVDHSSAGAQFLWNLVREPSETLLMFQSLSLIIASHHSGLIDCLDPNGYDNFTRRMTKLEGKTHLEEVKRNLDAQVSQEVKKITSDATVLHAFNRKVQSLKEENESHETFEFKIGLLVRFLFSTLIDADRIDTTDFEFPQKRRERNFGEYESWVTLIKRFNSYLRKVEAIPIVETDESKKVNTIRHEVSRFCYEFSKKPKGLYKLTVPTGGGKTLSSLRFALNHASIHNMDRIIYIIPYTSIIDQNAGRAREALDSKVAKVSTSESVVLEHHSNLTPENESARQNLLSENWDARVVFSTMVKFLETLFGSGTRDARRMHNLANSVIVFDEVQTLPVECVHMFNLAIRFLVHACGSTVVLCTATQPLLDKITPKERALIIESEQEIIPAVPKIFNELKRVVPHDKRKLGGWSVGEIVKLVRQELDNTGSVLIIVNTTGEARSLFQQFAEMEKGFVYHLSTNMCPAHRMKVLEQIKKRTDTQPVICISTQLIEAGIDIDFASVIRYVAGLDSIAQAAGRCNRNGSRSTLGRFFIINPQNENLDRLENIKIGKEIAERVLDEYKNDRDKFDNNIFGPSTIELFYKYYFYDRKYEMDYKVRRGSAIGREDNLFNLLSTNTLSLGSYQRVNNSSPELCLRQSFMTAAAAFKAIDAKKRGVIIPYEEGAEIILDLCGSSSLEMEYKLLKRAQRFTVEIFDSRFRKLESLGIIHEVQKGNGVFYLEKSYYSPNYGISETESDSVPFLNP